MLEDNVVFTIHGSAWHLTAVCFVTSAVLFVVWLVLLIRLLHYKGTSRWLSSEEAGQVAVYGSVSTTHRTMLVSGPAVGKEWNLSLSIGDLREAWHKRDYWTFFGMPAFFLLVFLAFELCFFGAALGLRSWVPLVAVSALIVPMMLIFLFMMWAAIYTKLN
jgi:hypothetical protein